jgi:hypothetical protein
MTANFDEKSEDRSIEMDASISAAANHSTRFFVTIPSHRKQCNL